MKEQDHGWEDQVDVSADRLLIESQLTRIHSRPSNRHPWLWATDSSNLSTQTFRVDNAKLSFCAYELAEVGGYTLIDVVCRLAVRTYSPKTLLNWA